MKTIHIAWPEANRGVDIDVENNERFNRLVTLFEGLPEKKALLDRQFDIILKGISLLILKSNLEKMLESYVLKASDSELGRAWRFKEREFRLYNSGDNEDREIAFWLRTLESLTCTIEMSGALYLLDTEPVSDPTGNLILPILKKAGFSMPIKLLLNTLVENQEMNAKITGKRTSFTKEQFKAWITILIQKELIEQRNETLLLTEKGKALILI